LTNAPYSIRLRIGRREQMARARRVPGTRPIPPLKGTTKKALDAYWANSISAAYEEPPECGLCGGPLVFLGTLGTKKHYRCRNCGMDWNFGCPAEEAHYKALAEMAEEEHLARFNGGKPA
jgi:hypothetical protein